MKGLMLCVVVGIIAGCPSPAPDQAPDGGGDLAAPSPEVLVDGASMDASDDPPTDGSTSDDGDTTASDGDATAITGDGAGSDDDAAPTRRPKVLYLGIDGVRPDLLEAANTPHLDALSATGKHALQVPTVDTTWSGPGWSTLLTGVWRDKHGVWDNSFTGQALDSYPNLLALVESVAPELNTVALTSWAPLHDWLTVGADERSFWAYDTDDGDVNVIARASETLNSEDPDLLFIYWADVDVVGHSDGFHPEVGTYVAELESVDADIGNLMASIAARPTFAEEDWLVLVSTDHGGTIDGTHGQNIADHRLTWIIVSGPQVTPGGFWPPARPVDLAATALTHLGIALDPTWDLDGQPLDLDVAGPPSAALGGNLLVNGGGEADRGFSSVTPDGWPPGWHDPGGMTAVTYGAPDFPSQDADGPPDRGANLFSGGNAAQPSMWQQVRLVELVEAHAAPLNYTLSGWLGGRDAQEDDSTARVDFYPTTFDDAFDGDAKAFFFHGASATRFDVTTDATDPGFPQWIEDTGEAWFTDIWPDGVDAGFRWDGKVWLFRADEVLRIDAASGLADPGFPQPIADGAIGGAGIAAATGVDAAVVWDNGKVYLFTGANYLRVDLVTMNVDAGYPLPIDNSTWPGLWTDGIDAAINWGNGRAYMFKGSEYVRYDMGADAVDDGYPKPIDAGTWPGLPVNGVDAAVYWEPLPPPPLATATIGPVTAGDRQGVTGLQLRSVDGIVPAGATHAVVTVTCRRVSGVVCDGYADELALVLDPPPP